MFETVPDDAALTTLLKAAKSRYDASSLRGLIAGVAAAADRDPQEWMGLVAGDPQPALIDALRALRSQARRAEADRASPEILRQRLAAMRKGMADQGLDGFLVPRADEHQNEYVPASAQRLAWLTGFTGSAGFAIVFADEAAIFVDGRYTLQVTAEIDPVCFSSWHSSETPPEKWLSEVLQSGKIVGYDPWLMTPDQLTRFRRVVEGKGATLVPAAHNPLDAAWVEKPPAPLGPVMAYSAELAGKNSGDKRAELAAKLIVDGDEAAVLTAPEAIAWLLNIRGADVPHTPLPLSFALVEKDGSVKLFIDDRKLLPGVREHLGNQVAVEAPDRLGETLDAMAGKRVQVDPTTTPSWIVQRLEQAGAVIHQAADPTRLPKACKNAVELDGIRAAHRRDGVAMTRFLAWFNDKIAGGETLTEIAVSDRLEAFRAEGDVFRDLSFDTISGAGPNGAIVHYRASPETERQLMPNSLFLLDSGAQYIDGTTDITRTLAIGTPTAEMKDRYTRVLKGHIALAMAIFPPGTPGPALDVLARQALWQAGLNYDHGTGHGVGAYLGVHEGPQRIHFQSREAQALIPGMVISNEPGYYKTGGYGIRIENLVAVVQAEIAEGEREMLRFETLTLCPIDKMPIDVTLLNAAEIAWLDGYHHTVRDQLLPLLTVTDPRAAIWLEQATGPLAG